MTFSKESSSKDHQKEVIADRRRLLLPRYIIIFIGFLLQFLAMPLRRRAMKRFIVKRRDIIAKGGARRSTESPEPSKPLSSHSVRQVNEPGFGDKYNSTSWSMKWWNGKLYVGTARAFRCIENYLVNLAFPSVKYPPRSPLFGCTPFVHDLPLQAEIWCFTPETEEWDRVYQSPCDVEVRGYSGKYTAQDIGFRYMTVFQEKDGKEALYVSGVSSRPINHGAPPPRILRSEDGMNFMPIPQDPGTVLGDIKAASFRSILVRDGRFFATAGRFFGSGTLFESTNPAGGNNHFEQITPDGMEIFEIAFFNGHLYLGLLDFKKGYSVVKMDISKRKPYPITPVVTQGGYRKWWKSNAVISMKVFKEGLYVGCDCPPELIRINPDDSWDLIVGMPRQTPEGKKYPLSGLEDGFNNWLNIHMQCMEVYNGSLYVGTANSGQYWIPFPVIGKLLRPYIGFALCSTSDGEQFNIITRNGLGNMFNNGIRTLQETPIGLFLGTMNYYHGTHILFSEKEQSRR